MINSRIFSKEEIQFILDNYKGIGNQELCDRLNEKFKTNHSFSRVKGFKSKHKLDSGLTGRFKKGHTTFNKGLKQTDFMSDEAIERTKKTRFKKGLKSHNKKPLGSERICTKDGYIIVKVGEPDVWEHKHRVVWEKVNGPIPKGRKIVFLDGDKNNISLDNLKIVSSGALAIVNRHIGLSDDEQLNETIYNTADLQAKLSNVEEEK